MPPSPSLCHPHSQTPGPGHLPDAIPRGARRPGAKLAALSRGAVPSSSSLLPSLEPVAAASGTRVSRLGSRAERRAPGAPRPPAGRVRAAGVSSHPPLPVAGGPGSAPPPPLARSSSPGRRRCPAPSAPVRAGQPGARAASAGPSGREWTEGKKPGGVGESREQRRAPHTPRPARLLPPETRGPPPGALAGHLVREVSPDRHGRAGSRGAGGSGAGAAGRRQRGCPRAGGRPGSASERADLRRRGSGVSSGGRGGGAGEARGRQAPGRAERTRKMWRKGPGAGSPGCSLAPRHPRSPGGAEAPLCKVGGSC